MHEGQLKTVSFLPMGNKVYPQHAVHADHQDEWTDASMRLFKIDLEPIYAGLNATEAVGEAYCTTDSCEVKFYSRGRGVSPIGSECHRPLPTLSELAISRGPHRGGMPSLDSPAGGPFA
jgi:hypothetical protein